MQDVKESAVNFQVIQCGIQNIISSHSYSEQENGLKQVY